MFPQTLSREGYTPAAALRGGRSARAKSRGHAAVARAGSINDLLVVLSPTEPHRDVAMRAQLLARDAGISHAVLFAPPPAKWQRLARSITVLRSRLAAFGTDVTARILRASFRADRTRLELRTPAEDASARATDLFLVGRRRAFPWSLAPLARYARRLLRRSRVPLLVVGPRPAGPYRNVVIATDLATDAGPALKWAREIAPGASLTLLHVYRGPFESKLQWAGVPSAEIRAHRHGAREHAAAGMSALLSRHRTDDVRRTLLVHGSPVHEVVRKARAFGADLIIVVRSNHSRWAEILGASASVEIAATADRDVLVVHGQSADARDPHA